MTQQYSSVRIKTTVIGLASIVFAPPAQTQSMQRHNSPNLQQTTGSLLIPPGLGSILDTVPEDTEDTAHLYLLYVSWTHFQTILMMASVSKYLKDTEDKCPPVTESVS